MKINDTTKLLLVILAVCCLLYYFNNNVERLETLDEEIEEMEEEVNNDFNDMGNELIMDENILAEQETNEQTEQVEQTGMFNGVDTGNDFATFNEQPQQDHINETVATINNVPFKVKEDVMDVNNYLPQESKDWFDDDIYRNNKHIEGVGLVLSPYSYSVNTIGTSNKNSSKDIRGDLVIPKTNVSVFNNSSKDPTINYVGLGDCH